MIVLCADRVLIVFYYIVAEINSILWKLQADNRIREAAKQEGLNGWYNDSYY